MKQKANFQLKITVPKGIEEVFLAKMDYAKPIIIDSSFVGNGVCTFKGVVNQPEKAVVLLGEKSSFPFILENTDFEIIFDKNDVESAQINHSELNNMYSQHRQKATEILAKMTPLYYQFQEKRLQNESEKLLEISSKIKAIKTSFLEYNTNFVQQHPSSYSSLFILKDLLNTAFIDTTTFLKETKKLSKKIQQHPIIKEIENKKTH